MVGVIELWDDYLVGRGYRGNIIVIRRRFGLGQSVLILVIGGLGELSNPVLLRTGQQGQGDLPRSLQWRIFLVGPRVNFADQSQSEQVVLDVNVGAVLVLLPVVPLGVDVQSATENKVGAGVIIPILVRIIPGCSSEEVLYVDENTLHVLGEVPPVELQYLHGGDPQHHAALQSGPDHLHQRRVERVEILGEREMIQACYI